MQGIALLMCRISILLLFLRVKNQYWYLIAKIKNARIGIGILLVYKSLISPTLQKVEGLACNLPAHISFREQLVCPALNLMVLCHLPDQIYNVLRKYLDQK